ncbi:hypothetical protein [Luteirhabdus pelagi]|uniref:hypothetical protein n=1 Tax=Luteirhabdus pelagi TaxID=2792783 RepID=UPI0019392E98|nr:hypothetical protein [Luteirhabdus pelagi]
MKNQYLLFLFSLTICISSFGQVSKTEPSRIDESEVPEAVTDNHNYFFPNSFNTIWKMQDGFSDTADTAVRYIVSFDDGQNQSYTASYLPGGQAIFHSKYMDTRNLPENIMIKLKYNNNDFEMYAADLITLYTPERQVYQVWLRKDTQVKKKFFDIDAQPIDERTLPPELILFTRQ